MISLETARLLKLNGLDWIPSLYDFFTIPDRNMDERVFVISDLLATIEVLGGRRVVAFQGASEWALDSLVIDEVVWLPREDQLRTLLESVLIEHDASALRLSGGIGGYTCTVQIGKHSMAFQARIAEEAYAQALLHFQKDK